MSYQLSEKYFKDGDDDGDQLKEKYFKDGDDDDAKVNYFTGVLSYKALIAVFEEDSRSTLTKISTVLVSVYES